jgi:RNA polymerase-binding transcription factor DksA
MAEAETEKLLAKREQTRAELKHLRGYLVIEVDCIIDGGEDSVDAASDVYEREKTLAIIQTLEKKLVSLDRALRAIEKGGYGICEICGAKIDPERLAVMPQATTCVKCQQKLERSSRRRMRSGLLMDDD